MVEEKELIDAAAKARLKARVPASGFRVGAALLTKEGKVFTGCNVELGTLLYSICAERCAIVKAVSEGYQEFAAIAIVSDQKDPVSPCGICRQFLIDFGGELKVIMSSPDQSRIIRSTAKELLPMAFSGTEKGISEEER